MYLYSFSFFKKVLYSFSLILNFDTRSNIHLYTLSLFDKKKFVCGKISMLNFNKQLKSCLFIFSTYSLCKIILKNVLQSDMDIFLNFGLTSKNAKRSKTWKFVQQNKKTKRIKQNNQKKTCRVVFVSFRECFGFVYNQS
jgi:hypothetical protein